MSLLERIARAISDASHLPPDDQAQAALEAMISEGAISERMNSDGAFQLFTGERIDEHSLTLARQCFRAMVKASIVERWN